MMSDECGVMNGAYGNDECGMMNGGGTKGNGIGFITYHSAFIITKRRSVKTLFCIWWTLI